MQKRRVAVRPPCSVRILALTSPIVRPRRLRRRRFPGPGSLRLRRRLPGLCLRGPAYGGARYDPASNRALAFADLAQNVRRVLAQLRRRARRRHRRAVDPGAHGMHSLIVGRLPGRLRRQLTDQLCPEPRTDMLAAELEKRGEAMEARERSRTNYGRRQSRIRTLQGGRTAALLFLHCYRPGTGASCHQNGDMLILLHAGDRPQDVERVLGAPPAVRRTDPRMVRVDQQVSLARSRRSQAAVWHHGRFRR